MTWNRSIILGRDNKSSIGLENYKEVMDTNNLKHHLKRPTGQGTKTIDHTVSNLLTERILIAGVLPCLIVSYHYPRYAIL